jgi:hypothetical protein
MRRLSLLLPTLMLLALAVVPATAASATTSNTSCPSSSSGWQRVDFQTLIDNNIQDALNAGMTVDQVLAIYGVTSLQDLYNLGVQVLQPVDKNGDGLLCAKDQQPSLVNLGIPYQSYIRDNNDATQS